MMALDIAANARPMPAPVSRPDPSDLPELRRGRSRAGRRPPTTSDGAEEHRDLGAEPAVQHAGQRAEDDHHDDGRQQEQAGLRRRTCRSRSRSPPAARAGSGRAGTCRTSRSRRPGRPRRWSTRRGSPSAACRSSGSRTRSSTRTNTTSATTPSTNRPTVLRLAPAPRLALADREQQRHQATDRMPAPSTSRRPGVRTGDSGMPKIAPSSAMTTRTSGSQNSQCHERCSTIGPAATMPTPAPTPKIAESRPTVTLTFSRGSSSRTMPIDSGRIAPAAPCSDAGDDQHGEVRGERGEQRAEQQRRQHADEHPALADHVAEPPEDRASAPTRTAGRP